MVVVLDQVLLTQLNPLLVLVDVEVVLVLQPANVKALLRRGAALLRQGKHEAAKADFLHAARLELSHPLDDQPYAWEAPVPTDLDCLLTALRDDRDRHRPGKAR